MNQKSGSRELLEYLLQDEDFRRAYASRSLSYITGRNVADARIMNDLTQKELAGRIGTSQPNIARIERGVIDSLGLVEKIAKALGTDVIAPTFTCLVKTTSTETHAVSYETREGTELVLHGTAQVKGKASASENSQIVSGAFS